MAVSGDVWSASEDECAGWLCITVGFAPPECSAPRRAMMKRLLRGKGPLPSFGSCSADGDSNGFDVQMATAARIGRSDPPRYMMGTSCSYDSDNRVDGDRIPAGCTGTYRAIAVTQHGILIGDILFVRKLSRPRRDRRNNFDDND